jgi:hypothetical protein
MKYVSFIVALITACGLALAGPGAHGPNGEHLDGPASNANLGALPLVEAFTESFELVGQLAGGELSIMVDRYDTNEPVLNGELEVQFKDLKAKAKFHADHGDYSIDDPKFLKAISVPGKHALVFTFVSGEESDLLEGMLVVANDDHHHEAGPAWPYWAGAAILAALIAAAAVILRRRKESLQ